MGSSKPNAEILGVDGAHAAAEDTVEAIEAAATKNEDPVVAEILDEAALAADTTSSRIGWLRSALRARFRPQPS
jgi:hypothetical protein